MQNYALASMYNFFSVSLRCLLVTFSPYSKPDGMANKKL